MEPKKQSNQSKKRSKTETKVNEFLEKKGHKELVAGGAIGAVGVGSAAAVCAGGVCTAGIIIATACPLCLVLAPILILVGAYKKYVWGKG